VKSIDENKFKAISQSIRRNALASIYYAGSGHPGGVLSAADILTVLFFKVMNFSKENIDLAERDRFILSKGHSVPVLYAIGVEKGLLPEDELRSLRKLNSRLQGHPDRLTLPWLEASTGSLGQGFSFAVGEAYGFRYQNIKNRIFVMLGDGEMQEGEVWEAAMFSAHYRLSNLCAIVDYNKMQSDNLNENIISLKSLPEKWKAFNWNVIEADGHNFSDILKSFKEAERCMDKPTVIIAHTIKGKGISYMEGSPLWHGSVKLSREDFITILKELNCKVKETEDYLNE
jgi:transketolase